ncbi:MAG: glutathione peroxidase [Armatimonadota bacterium]|nr:glutathione peroxidase [Armatimonadota bacterium]
MHILSVLAGLGFSAALLLPVGAVAAADEATAPSEPLAFTVKDNSGKDVPLSHYKGKVVMIVNTASLCGNTPQYAALETLYKKYQDRGLRILAFPANNFGQQEPGDNSSIKQFCTSKYQVTFDLFSKLSVAGADQAPLYKYLTDKATDPKFGGPIDWNFAKFLVGRDGQLAARFPAGHSPLSPDVVAAVEDQLKTDAKP